MFKFRFQFLAVSLALVLAAGCATLPSEPIPGKIYLQDLCGRHNIECDWDNVSQVITLARAGQKAQALVSSNVVIIGSDTVYLSQPLVRERNAVIVPEDFKSKVIDKMLRLKAAAVPWVQKVIIDPGHGGRDPGAIGISGVHEEEIVYDIAVRLKKELRKEGIQAVLTRGSGEYVTLEKRTEIASRHKADLFVSVHANSNPSRKVQGAEIYALRPLSAKEENEEQRKRNRWLMINEIDMSKDDEILKDIVYEMLLRYKQVETPRIASFIAQDMSSLHLGSRPAIKEAGFFVLRNTLIPSVLIEVGYLSNRNEEKRLRQASYRQEIAEDIARGIISYATK